MGEPRERGILFSAPMVRALLEGRKTQTRRVVKEEIPPGADEVFGPPRYGSPGDRLWVRETWGLARFYADGDFSDWDGPIPKVKPAGYGVPYAADEPESTLEDRGFRWRPSIFMPRWASRITLELTEVRVQRLQEISEEDAQAEGIVLDAPPPNRFSTEARTQFAQLWESINGQREGASWKANPWVWALTFRRVMP